MQMGDNSEVLKSISRKDGVWYPVLTPNIKVKTCVTSDSEASFSYRWLIAYMHISFAGLRCCGGCWRA